MTNDILKRAKDYLDQTKEITKGEWLPLENGKGVGIYKGQDDPLEEGEYLQPTAEDYKSMALTPEARKLIKMLCLEVIVLREHAPQPKTEFDDEIEIYKRLKDR